MIPFHPLANIFPLIEGGAFDDLVHDIKANGLQEKIVLFDDHILDGRNRYRACLAAGVTAASILYEGDDALAFVVSKNLRRRHLKESQRALIAARLANLRQGRRRDLRTDGSISQSESAQLLNVSVRSLGWARHVVLNGTPSLTALVEKGNLSISAAGKIATLAEAKQKALVAEGPAVLVAEVRRLTSRKGRQGRSEYAILWSIVDEVSDALQHRRLDNAHAAGKRLLREIERVVASRRARP